MRRSGGRLPSVRRQLQEVNACATITLLPPPHSCCSHQPLCSALHCARPLGQLLAGIDKLCAPIAPAGSLATFLAGTETSADSYPASRQSSTRPASSRAPCPDSTSWASREAAVVAEPLQQASSAGPRSQQQALDAAVALNESHAAQCSQCEHEYMPMLHNLVENVALHVLVRRTANAHSCRASLVMTVLAPGSRGESQRMLLPSVLRRVLRCAQTSIRHIMLRSVATCCILSMQRLVHHMINFSQHSFVAYDASMCLRQHMQCFTRAFLMLSLCVAALLVPQPCARVGQEHFVARMRRLLHMKARDGPNSAFCASAATQHGRRRSAAGSCDVHV